MTCSLQLNSPWRLLWIVLIFEVRVRKYIKDWREEGRSRTSRLLERRGILTVFFIVNLHWASPVKAEYGEHHTEIGRNW